MESSPSVNTLWTVGLFAVAYIVMIARATAYRRLDLYDFLLLSMAAIVPVLFTFASGFTDRISTFLGVRLPLIVMFGVLIVTLFIFVNRLTAQLHEVRNDNDLLVQELSLLSFEIGRLSDFVHNSTDAAEPLRASPAGAGETGGGDVSGD